MYCPWVQYIVSKVLPEKILDYFFYLILWIFIQSLDVQDEYVRYWQNQTKKGEKSNDTKRSWKNKSYYRINELTLWLIWSIYNLQKAFDFVNHKALFFRSFFHSNVSKGFMSCRKQLSSLYLNYLYKSVQLTFTLLTLSLCCLFE